MKLVKAAGTELVLDRARPITELEQLPYRDYAVLPCCQLGKWAGFGRYMRLNSAHLGHTSDGGRPLVKDQHALRQLRNK
jgi:hypothetical protein